MCPFYSSKFLRNNFPRTSVTAKLITAMTRQRRKRTGTFLITLAVTLVLGKLFRMNLEELLLSVNATLGGAPSAVAMAVSAGWSRLVLPGLLAGVWGYVIGTFIGIAVAEALLRLLKT